MSDRAESASEENIPLPAFLQQPKADLANTFIDLEWKQRNRLLAGQHTTTPPSPWSRLNDPTALSRNRYVNVDPFAANRIRLKVADGINDYINASPIVLGSGRRYIATQGPKDTSTGHFWRMVASETSNPAVIVMLTQTAEGGREKCFQYFPLDAAASPIVIAPDASETDEVFEGLVEWVSSEEDVKSRCTMRKFRLRTRIKRGGKMGTWMDKEVWHLLYAGWPDFLVPEGDDRRALVELVHLSRRLNKDAVAPVDSSFEVYNPPATNGSASTAGVTEHNPRIIHCSAGVGRSGTFIALDHLLTMLDAGQLDEVDPGTDVIAELVDALRRQRMMMVQGEQQFMFLYDVLRECWTERWREKHAEH